MARRSGSKGRSRAKVKAKVRTAKPRRNIRNTYVEKVIVVTAKTK